MTMVGSDAIGVGYILNKDKPEAKSTLIDLRASWGQAALKKLIKDIKAKLALIAPPCGSAARCREIMRKFGPEQKPPRPDDYPDGLPELDGNDKERVEHANTLYKFVAELALELGHAEVQNHQVPKSST